MAAFAGDPLDRTVRPLQNRIAVTEEEEREEDRQRELENSAEHCRSARDQDPARRLDIVARLCEELCRVVRKCRPGRGDGLPDQRKLRHPFGRLRRSVFQRTTNGFTDAVAILGNRYADDHERCQHRHRDQNDHRQCRKAGASAQPPPHSDEERPYRRRQDQGPDDGRQEGLQDEETADDEHREDDERQRAVDAKGAFHRRGRTKARIRAERSVKVR